MVKIDMSDWRMRDYIAFMDALEAQNWKAMAQGLSKIVTEWDYEGDPREPESYLDLRIAEWVEVSKAVGEHLQKGLSSGN